MRQGRTEKEHGGGPAVPVPFLALTTALCGALVMVIEVMGSRVIGPFFGVSLFVWTALITVTLIALAAGYAAGGWLADRRGSPDVLYGLILLAGIAVLAIPPLKGLVLTALAPAGLRTGALLASFILFGPSLFLLGCVSPFVVRLASPSFERIGRTVGLLYALSTVGSFVGTVTTGFYLIAFLGVRGIFRLAGGILVGLAVVWFAGFRARRATAALLLLPLLSPTAPPFTSTVMANGTRVTRVFRKEGFYADLQVLDYSFGPVHTREMVLDGLVQGGVDVTTGASVYGYAYVLEQLLHAARPGGTSCLVVGLGAGVVPRRLEERGASCDVVDINPDVVDAARAWFGYAPKGEVHVADARRFLAETTRRYDWVVLDVFTGDTTPGHLLTREAMALLHARVAPGGVLAANLIGTVGAEGGTTASILATAATAFTQVRLFTSFDPAAPGAFGNLALIAHDGEPRRLDPSRLDGFRVHPLARREVEGVLEREYSFPPGTPSVVLTDDDNPVDFLERNVRERVRRTILAGTQWQALL